MASLRVNRKNVPAQVNFIVAAGLKPDATIRMTSGAGSVVDLHLEYDELLQLVAAIITDPRFQIEKRAPGRDKSLDAKVDDLLAGLGR